MELFIISLMTLVALELAALRWGFDSRDGIDSHDLSPWRSTFFKEEIL